MDEPLVCRLLPAAHLHYYYPAQYVILILLSCRGLKGYFAEQNLLAADQSGGLWSDYSTFLCLP